MGALRGTGDVILPTATYAISFWGCALPLCYYLGYRQATGAAGIAWGLTAGLVIACVMLGLRFAVVARRRLYAV
jgi:multidrug resistance protein, MATE family